MDSIKAQWPKVLQAVQQRKMSTAAYLMEAQPVALEGSRLTIGFPKEFLFHKEAVERPEHRAAIEAALQRVVGWTGRVALEVAEGLAVSAPSVFLEEPGQEVSVPAATPPAEEPPIIVKSAAELFGGRIVPPSGKR